MKFLTAIIRACYASAAILSFCLTVVALVVFCGAFFFETRPTVEAVLEHLGVACLALGAAVCLLATMLWSAKRAVA